MGSFRLISGILLLKLVRKVTTLLTFCYWFKTVYLTSKSFVKNLLKLEMDVLLYLNQFVQFSFINLMTHICSFVLYK